MDKAMTGPTGPGDMTMEEMAAAAKRYRELTERPSVVLAFFRSSRWRMLQWFVVAAALVALCVLWFRHPQIQNALGGLAKLAMGAGFGYWAHRTAHRNYRPDDQQSAYACAVANGCKAFIMGCSIIGAAMVLS